jgi:photosystem II stability/assembly factor-like uncharacterized protein
MSDTKQIILRVVFLIIIPTFIVASWSRPKPAPVKFKFSKAALLPPEIKADRGLVTATPYLSDFDLANSQLWAIDERGSVLSFSSGGLESMKYAEGFNAGTSISFIDSKNGWAFVPGKLFGSLHRTTDGGLTWNELATNPEFSTVDFQRLHFVDLKHGWLSDMFRVWQTVDGGKHWKQVLRDDTRARGINDIAFVNATTVMLTQANGQVLVTHDAGNTWLLGKGVSGVDSIAARGRYAWAIGINNALFQSADSGRTWVELPPLNSVARITSMQFISSSEGWGAGSEAMLKGQSRMEVVGVLFHTKDGGRTWEKVLAPSDSDFRRVAFLNSSTGWLMGHNGLYQTNDGGQSWKTLLER